MSQPPRREASVSLFAYGTLQQANVQLTTFGRLLDGRQDALTGFTLAPITITDPAVIAASGLAVHRVARRSDIPTAPIPGMVFSITQDELEAADVYEANVCVRIEIQLASGARAFAYIDAAV